MGCHFDKYGWPKNAILKVGAWNAFFLISHMFPELRAQNSSANKVARFLTYAAIFSFIFFFRSKVIRTVGVGIFTNKLSRTSSSPSSLLYLYLFIYFLQSSAFFFPSPNLLGNAVILLVMQPLWKWESSKANTQHLLKCILAWYLHLNILFSLIVPLKKSSVSKMYPLIQNKSHRAP